MEEEGCEVKKVGVGGERVKMIERLKQKSKLRNSVGQPPVLALCEKSSRRYSSFLGLLKDHVEKGRVCQPSFIHSAREHIILAGIARPLREPDRFIPSLDPKRY